MSSCTRWMPPMPTSTTLTPAGSVPSAARRLATSTPKPSSRRKMFPIPATRILDKVAHRLDRVDRDLDAAIGDGDRQDRQTRTLFPIGALAGADIIGLVMPGADDDRRCKAAQIE